jgi:sporulation protein YlmC with PRC-barrel domain
LTGAGLTNDRAHRKGFKEAHMKRIATLAAVSALMMGTALAQTPSSPPAQPSAPAATPAPSTSGSPQFIQTQTPDQFLASKFKGTDVMGADDQKIGDVSDILFDKSGKIHAYVVSVGGFLGMGSKDVALAPEAFTVIPGSNGNDAKLKTSMNKDQLKQAAAFEAYKAPRATTGMGGGGSPAPRMRP